MELLPPKLRKIQKGNYMRDASCRACRGLTRRLPDSTRIADEMREERTLLVEDES